MKGHNNGLFLDDHCVFAWKFIYHLYPTISFVQVTDCTILGC